tara:strand:+ start:473 stop:1330 length:858 start_codon:yes stop_codon:yes gene_type:complete
MGMKKLPSKSTAKRLVDIESKDRFNSDSIGVLADNTELLQEYLESSIAHSFSELMFRMTHENYSEEKAKNLWNNIITHRTDLERQLGRDMGMMVAALDYLSNVSRDISNPKIIDDLRIEEAADLATRDALTGLYVRSVFDFSIDRMLKEHQRSKSSLSIMMIDIDDFKVINDKQGHQAGDNVLRKIGQLIQDNIRKSDFPARYGGDEFTIILPDTDIEPATGIAEKLRNAMHQGLSLKEQSITLSIGLCCTRDQPVLSATELIRQADTALYQAKTSGKNKVVSSA